MINVKGKKAALNSIMRKVLNIKALLLNQDHLLLLRLK